MASSASSHFFSYLHHEAAPVGNIGRGSHHSVCRTVTWLDETLVHQFHALVHDFAIIWDEDHDERIISVVEGLLMDGLLAPVLFIGERKGTLNVVVDAALFATTSNVNREEYVDRVEAVCQKHSGDDYWPTEVVALKRAADMLEGRLDGGIIQDEDARSLAYLNAINVLWNLGVKPYRSRAVEIPWATTNEPG